MADLERLRGEWTLVREVPPSGLVQTYGGAKDSSIGHWNLTFDGQKFVTEEDYTDPPYEISGTVTLNVDQKPRRIDLTVVDVSAEVDRKYVGKSRRGIYELEGDRLKICMPYYGDAKRPTEFKHGNGYGVYEFKRVKR